MKSRTNLVDGSPEPGREAEELRAGVAELISGAEPSHFDEFDEGKEVVSSMDLQRLLDDVDARDSLAFQIFSDSTIGRRSNIALAVNFDAGSDVSQLVYFLREGMMPLVRDGIIDDERACERANNIAMILMGHFKFEKLNAGKESE